uniref:Sodium/calcium exchanger membrane region domain-containing protein n=1 Tax=Equus asinus TaxID=9793 RepID=A0A8C4LQD6_EQUAS
MAAEEVPGLLHAGDARDALRVRGGPSVFQYQQLRLRGGVPAAALLPGDHGSDPDPRPQPPGLQEVEEQVSILEGPQGAQDGVYEIGGLVPVWAVVVIAGTAVAAVTFFATSNRQPPRLHWLFAFLGFLTSALWINAAATEVVNILRSLGVVFRLSNTVLGLTLLAWGNSIGDVFSDFTLARQGYPRMAYSACFGGIIFNILVGVGLGCLLQISRGHTEVKLEPDGLLVWVLAGALGLSLVCSLVSVPLQCFQLSKAYGLCLLLFYVSFLIVALLTEFGVIHLKSV